VSVAERGNASGLNFPLTPAAKFGQELAEIPLEQ